MMNWEVQGALVQGGFQEPLCFTEPRPDMDVDER